MKKNCQIVLAAAMILAACGSDKSVPADQPATPAAVPQPAALPLTSDSPPPAVQPAPVTKTAAAPVVTQPPSASTPVVRPEPPPVVPPATAPVTTPKPAPVAAVPSAPTVDPLAGKPVYDAQCRRCHGVIGVPPKVMQTKFPRMMPFDAALFAKTTDDAIVAILMNGKGDDMKSFKDKLSHTEMVAVAAYIRTLGQKP